MADMSHGALLDLDTLVERPRIKIDGTNYEILSPAELSVIDSHRFAVWGRRIDALGKAGRDSDEAGIDADASELKELIDKVAQRICVGVPADVFAKIPGKQRWAIVDVFTALLLREQLKVAGAMATATGPTPDWMAAAARTGVQSFPGFNGSTVDAPKTGLKRFLQPLFARS